MRRVMQCVVAALVMVGAAAGVTSVPGAGADAVVYGHDDGLDGYDSDNSGPGGPEDSGDDDELDDDELDDDDGHDDDDDGPDDDDGEGGAGAGGPAPAPAPQPGSDQSAAPMSASV